MIIIINFQCVQDLVFLLIWWSEAFKAVLLIQQLADNLNLKGSVFLYTLYQVSKKLIAFMLMLVAAIAAVIWQKLPKYLMGIRNISNKWTIY